MVAVHGVTPGRYRANPPSIDQPEFLLLARRDWETEMTLDASDVTAHGALPGRYWTCEVVALRSRPVDPVFLDRMERAGELRPHALEAWQRGIGRGAREAIAG